jgi:hypothetical protein
MWRAARSLRPAAAASVLAGAVACGFDPGGDLSAPGTLAVAGPAQVGRPVAIGGPWLCSHGDEPTRLVSIEPITQVGKLTMRPAVHQIDTGDPTDLVGGTSDPLPASYRPVDGAEVPRCSTTLRLALAVEATRLNTRSAAVAGLRITYLERNTRHTTEADMSFGLCGTDGTTTWPNSLNNMHCQP